MSDIHALTGAYALDSLSDIERAGFERHLSGCAACRDEVDGLREAAVYLADTSTTEPPPDLRARILAEAQTVRPLPPRAPHRGVGAHARTRRIPALAAAAALVVGLSGITASILRPWQPDTVKVQLTLADRIRQAPDAQTWTQGLAGGGQATVTRSETVGAALWETRGLKAAPVGRVYQLWLQAPDESLQPAGLMSSGDGEAVLRGDAMSAIGAGLTDEPSGGSPAPTTKPIAFVDFRVAQ